MEKFSFGEKAKKIAGILGLSALSMMPGDKMTESAPTNDTELLKNKTENKIEWGRKELETNKSSIKDIALSQAQKKLISEEWITFLENRTSFIEESMAEYSAELEYRESRDGNSTKKFSQLSSEYIQNEIEDWEKLIENEQEKLDKIYNEELFIPSSNEVNEAVEEIRKTIYYYDLGRRWLLDNIHNPIYSKRIKEEWKDSYPDLTLKELQQYSDEAVSYRSEQASDEDFTISEDILKSYGDSTANVGAFFNVGENEIYFPLDKDSLTAINLSIHEYSHKITRGESFMSEKAINLFANSFDTVSVVANLTDKSEKGILETVKYLSSPTELYARKKQFDHDLERLGIKKYEEEFTIEHYLKALMLEREGKLSLGSIQFIYSIRPNMMKRIMNEIAKSDIDEEKMKNTV